MMTTKMAIGYGLKFFLQWVKVTALKTAKKAFLIALVVFGLGLVGLLPRSPFRILNNAIMSEYVQASSILRYIPAFIPIHEMLLFFVVWILGVGGWYAIKVFLRATKVVR